MQVNLMIDDNLLQQAMQVSGLTTTQEVMERALRSFVVSTCYYHRASQTKD